MPGGNGCKGKCTTTLSPTLIAMGKMVTKVNVERVTTTLSPTLIVRIEIFDIYALQEFHMGAITSSMVLCALLQRT